MGPCLLIFYLLKKSPKTREFPGGLLVRIWCFHCCGLGSIPGWGTEIPQAVWCAPPPKKNQNQNQKKTEPKLEREAESSHFKKKS